ncbi:NAD(P)H-dependent glycerol-3-phosphate dehydrogenase [Glaciecola sp. XM2]|jgi:glycerol-3-phosphate dehydrogenase (NAD(P)+)|uniref:NAD(P)H-dependent glycerol-3-phosphate dehydrogenase n=1 Tax=Glaciecola sp. XM2 TaxID=1914931 RepID=UPI001BDE0EF4|nr:NAD(P)H-dependent glycerol-3-phosphate dehydrogenase [Glaciecola sp. XM2]MBT1449818.1 NAD(P)H-dependent glycerol-3-phosphate dehydrogenase [Glaciecola sp. XM2]
MTQNKANVSIIGAGSYGTALAFCLSRNEHPSYLWGRNADDIASMERDRANNRYLEGFVFPEHLHPCADLEFVVKQSEFLLVVVPSFAFADMLRQIKPFLQPHHKLIWASKGLEPDTGRLLHCVVEDILGKQLPKAVLSGPTFAKEMAAGLPTAITLASEDEQLAVEFSQMLNNPKNFRVYLNDDLIGVQLGGAVKNVIAIGAGLADGLGFGANARTALITRGLAEMKRLGVAIGASSDSFMGMAGLGDLVLTCTDNQSRNRRFGLALGQGLSVEDAIASIGQVVEGHRNTDEVHILSKKYNIEMPICEQIYQVLYHGKSAKEAAVALLSRQQTSE